MVIKKSYYFILKINNFKQKLMFLIYYRKNKFKLKHFDVAF